MSLEIRQATAADLPVLVELMREFYAESDYPLNTARARAAFVPILEPGSLGQVWMAGVDGQVAGHVVLTFGYSMEYGGRNACIDDLFVRPAFRNRGVGKALLRRARAACEALGIRAICLEVARANGPAQTVYRAVGFRGTEQELLAL